MWPILEPFIEVKPENARRGSRDAELNPVFGICAEDESDLPVTGSVEPSAGPAAAELRAAEDESDDVNDKDDSDVVPCFFGPGETCCCCCSSAEPVPLTASMRRASSAVAALWLRLRSLRVSSSA